MRNPKISIIIPVYNVEQYLSRCVESILNQTFSDFELLLIDDGSPDKSGKICDEYAMTDSRIRVFHKENDGVSSARNLGLDNARGEWVTFVDSDDWIKNNYLKVFNDNSCYDLIICGYQEFGYSDKKKVIKEHYTIKVDANLLDIWEKHLSTQCFVYWYPWAKFYKNRIIQSNRIRFNKKMIYSEDFCFVLDYMSCIDEYKILLSTEYQYYIGASRYDRYKMDYSLYYKHLVYQNDSLKKLENRCGGLFLAIRENLGNRFYSNFINYVLSIDNYKSYKEQMHMYNDNKKSINTLALLPTNKRFNKFDKFFSLPSLLGFYFLTFYKKRLW